MQVMNVYLACFVAQLYLLFVSLVLAAADYSGSKGSVILAPKIL